MNTLVQPTALNLLVVGFMVVIFAFFWRMAAAALVNRNPESGLGKAMSVLL